MAESHQEINEEMQDLLSWIGDLIDEGEGATGTELNEMYEWIEQIMVDHHSMRPAETLDWCPRCNAGPGRCSCPWW